MKLIIDIDDNVYNRIKNGYPEPNDCYKCQDEVLYGKPYDERTQGEWTDLSTDGRHTGWIACSVCGQEPPNESNLRTKFCPNCGAKMKGGTE